MFAALALTLVALAACSDTNPSRVAAPVVGGQGIARWDVEPPPPSGQRVILCKEQGPFGQYHFTVNVTGGVAGVDYTLPNGTNITLVLNEAVPSHHCTIAWEALASGVSSTIRITEVDLPEGVAVQKIDLVNPDGTIARTISGSTFAEFVATYTSAYAVKFYNGPYTPPPPPSTGCTRTIGYWKNWSGTGNGNQADKVTPLLPIWLGTAGGAKSVQVTTNVQAVAILGNNGSNGISKLMAQLLGAKLSIGAGASGTAVASTIGLADAFLATHNEASWSSLTAAQRNMVLGWKDTLDSYNNGLIGPVHCD